MLVEYSVPESSQCPACFADASSNLFVQRAVMGDGASQVLEALNVCELGATYGDGLRWMVGFWCPLVKHFGLAEADCQAKQLGSL